LAVQLVARVYDILTGREEAAVAEWAAGTAGGPAATPFDLPLPEVSPEGLSGLLEILAARGGRECLADDLTFEVDDLLPLVEAAEMLGLATVDGAHLEISDAGREFATGNTGASKTLFDELISERTPLIKAIMWALHALPTGPFARASPSTGCAAVSPPRRPGGSSTPPSSGAATASRSNTTRKAASWCWAPTRLKSGDGREQVCQGRNPGPFVIKVFKPEYGLAEDTARAELGGLAGKFTG
jgi:hypothetical protein